MNKKPRQKQAVKGPRGKSARRGNRQVVPQSQAKPTSRKKPGARRRGEADVLDVQRLLLVLTRLQALYIDDAKPEALFGALLEELLKLTDSQYGFIGEVLRSDEGQPYLRTHAITDIAWNDETKALLAAQAPTLVFRNLNTLFGHVMTTGKPVIANDPANDPRAGGLPPGHPPMHAFLGLPFYRGELLTGMVGVANRPGGYDERLVAYLEPFLSTCAQLLEGYRNRRLRADAEDALHQSEDRFRAAIQGANEGIWDWNLTTNEVHFSPRWKAIIGYEDHEISNSYEEWESRLHPEDRRRVLAHLRRYLEGKIEQYAVEFRLRKKLGDYCWIHARGSVICDSDGNPFRMAGSHTDITERKVEEALQTAEKQALELVAKGTPLDEVMASICRTIETHTAPMLCSVMLVTDDRTHLSLAAGPSLPDEYNRAIGLFPIGPTIGSCGSAAHFKALSIVTDIATDPLWKDYASVAVAQGLKACWSQPICSATGVLLGIFAAYYREIRSPQPADLRIVERASHIAALAIEHTRMTEALRESEARFQAFMNYSPVVSFIKDEAGRHLYVNPSFERCFQVSFDQVRGKTNDELMPATVAAKLNENDRRVLSAGDVLEFEETVPTPDGQSKHWLVLKFPLKGVKEESLLGGVAVDITERKRLERATQDQTDRLRLAMDVAGIAIWDWNILSNKVVWSNNCEEIKRLPIGSFDGAFETYQRMVHPEDLPKLLADVEDALSGQKPYHTEHRIVPPTGEVQWVEGNGVVYRDESGRPIRMVGTVRNITERKRIEQVMRVSEERYARATAVGQVGVWEVDVHAGLYYGDKNLKAMFGYQADELSTDPYVWLNVVHRDDQSIAMTHWQRIVRGEGDDYQYEIRMVRKGGEVIWTDVRGHAVRDVDGQVTHLIGATVNITERKRMEEALRESEERHRSIVAAMAEGVVIQNNEGRILSCNGSACRILGLTEDQVLGRTSLDGRWRAIHEDGSPFPGETHPAMETLRTWRACENVVMGVHRPDETLVWISINTQPIAVGKDKPPSGVVASFRDITAQKQSHADMKMFRALLDQVTDSIEVIDPVSGQFLDGNQQSYQSVGYTRTELLALTVPDIDPLVTKSDFREHMRRMREGDRQLVIQSVHQRRDGTRFPVEVSAQLVDLDREYLVAIVRDVTERNRIQDALRESEERFRTIADTAPALIRMAGLDKKSTYFNQRWLTYTGRTLEQEMGDGWADGVHPDDFARCLNIYSSAFDRRESFEMEYRLRKADGEYGWIHDSGVPRVLPDGTFAGYLGACIDITARKQAESARETLQYAVDRGIEGIALLDSEGRYTYVNEAHAQIYGFSASELIGRSWKTLYDQEQTVWIEARALAIMQAEQRWSGELVGRTKAGAVVYAEVGLQLLPQRGTVPQGFLCTCRDITMRKKAEESLQRTQFAMDQAVDAVYWIDPQARILYTNEAARTMLGYTSDEFLQMTVHDVNPNFPPEVWTQWWAELREKKVMSLESVHLSKDGRRIPIDIRVSYLAYGGQEFHCAFVRDISKRKEAEEAAYRSFSLLQSVLHTAPIRVFWKDRASRYLGCNRQFALDAGCADAEEIVGKTDDELVWNQQAPLYQADDRQVMESGCAKLDFDEPGTTREGRSSWLRTSKVPLRDEQGHVIGVLGVYEDVTDRKRMEAALDALARGTGAVVGHEFFPVFVKELAQALQVHYAGVCDFFQERPGYAKVRAMWNGEEWMPPFEYALASTPCGEVVCNGFASYPSSVRELFPEDADLVTLQAESYLGFLLRSGSGEPMGHIFMIDDKPLADSKQTLAIMQIFAARAAAELERIRADDALRASQERFELAVRASNDGIWDWNILTGEQDWSDRHFELFGLEPQAFAPTYEHWISLVHPDDADLVRQTTQRHLDTREPYDIEVRVRMRDGSLRWFHDRGQAVWDSSGRPVRMVGSVADVTERKAAQSQLEQHVAERTAALRRSEQRYVALVNSVDGIIMEFDFDASRTTFVSQQAERIIGYPLESWMDDPSFFWEHLHPDDRERVFTYCADMTKQGLNHEMEYRMLGRDGRIIWIRDLISLMHADDGTVKLCCILMDVTKQKEIGNRLQLTQFTVDRAAQGIFWVGPNAEILYVNEAACSVLGYSRAELLNMTVHDVDPNFPPEIWPAHWEELKRRGSFTFESSQLTKEGKVRYTEITVNYLEYGGQEYNCANVRDITERKMAADAIRDSELRYKLLTEATFDGIAIHDNGVLLEVNPGIERMFGYEPGELIGRSMWDLIAEESRDLIAANMRNGVTGPYEAIGRRKDGTTFPGEVVVRPYRYCGKNVRLVAGRDITERKHLEVERLRYTEELERQVAERTAEVTRLESQRAQTEKLAALGRLAAGVAHEINNPMAGIKNAFTLVRQAVDPAHPNAEFAGLIDREIARVSSIIQNMYQLCRPESRQAEVVDLRSLVKDLDTLLTPQLQQRRLTFTAEMEHCPTRLSVPRGDLVQVLLNLLTNAIECSPEGEWITLSLEEKGEWIRLAVRDHGAGIESEHLLRIFDPFYTTKTGRDQKGMGLGLSVSQSLVQAMGGTIAVDTQLGRGSTFTVCLPRMLVHMGTSTQSDPIKEVVTHDR